MPFDTAHVVETFRDLLADKKPAQARAVLEEALKEKPADAKLHYQMGRFYEEEIRHMNFWDTAAIRVLRTETLRCYMKAATFDASSHMYAFSVAVTARKLGLDKGMPFIKKAIRLDPNNVNYRRELGKQYTAANNHQEAEKQFKRALEMDQNDHVSWYDFAINQIALGQARTAKLSLDNARTVLAGKDRDFDGRITEALKRVHKIGSGKRDTRVRVGSAPSPAFG